MGCVISSSHVDEFGGNRVRKPKPWKHEEAQTISSSDLRAMRASFWAEAPGRYGGRRAIWEVLQDAAECDDLQYKQSILEIYNIRLGNPYMTVCFDDVGNRYELPVYVLSEPTNLNQGDRTIFRCMFSS